MRRWYRWASQHDHVFFVQIGSNDGVSGDPLARFIDTKPGWRGVFVEPEPSNFAKLAERRPDPRFKKVRAAITEHDGSTTLHVVDSADPRAAQLATLDAGIAASHHVNLPDFAMRPIEVPALTFATLTRDLDEMDVLHIDAEGHDATILAQVDFDRWALPVVLFEHAHLAALARESCATRLREHGYKLWSNDWDTLAMR
jgi:FkbM family methyltransferase